MKKTIYKHLFLLLAIILAGTGQAYADTINKGDANSDNSINVADIVMLRRKINLDPPANFNEWAADANGDGSYNVADIVVIRNIINYTSLNANGTLEGWTEGNTEEELEPQPLGEDEKEDNYGD